MNEILRLERVDFDVMENHNARTTKVLGVFVAGDGLTAHGRASAWLRAQPPTKLFLGHDGQVYPQYRFVPELSL